MKRSKLALALSLIMILSLLIPSAYAATPDDFAATEEGLAILRFLRIDSLKADLSISSAGRSTSYGKVSLSNSSDTVNLTVELQQKDGNSWSHLKSWSASGSGTVSLEQDWYVVSGYTYRVVVTAKVYNSSGALVETAVAYSNSVSY